MQFRKACLILWPAVILTVSLLAMLASAGVTFYCKVMGPAQPVKPTVVIDPGHGGEDGGAISCTGVRESLLNLAVGRRLEDLAVFLGMRTKMTRSTDVSICDPTAQTVSEKKVSDLKNRVRLVNETDAPILVSIHQNMFQEEKYAGAQVFYADTEGSRELAGLLQTVLRTSLDPSNRREPKLSRSVYLLNKIRCAGVLIECGFLSNRNEEALLRTELYQKKLCCAIAGALRRYLTELAGPA